jgi:chemotaxis protein MotA
MKTSRTDFATLGGFLLALAGILGGLLLEGGALSDIAQYTAALIVIGGTMGAVMITTPMVTLKGALRRVPQLFSERWQDPAKLVEEVIAFATKARKSGLISLEDDAEAASDPFLKKALNLAVDGCDIQEIRKMMELEMDLAEERAEAEAKVFEAAGGYAPTIGIIGAVLGLIQVMKKLADTDQVGHGIAIAFVATVYGVGLANIFLLPVAGKIKARARDERAMRQLMLEGVTGIVEGLNPKLIRANLEAFTPQTATRQSKSSASRREAA